MNIFRDNQCALPENLKNKRHTDWPPLLNKLSRGINARGPRCKKGSPGYMAWPPRLVEGKGVSRWELAGGGSVIWIPALDTRRVKYEDVYGKKWDVVEMNPGDERFGKLREVYIPHWEEATYTEGVAMLPNNYSPSALQKFSKEGFLKMSPSYTAHWWRNKNAVEGRPLMDVVRQDRSVVFVRHSWRPDHLQFYFNFGPYAGLRWE